MRNISKRNTKQERDQKEIQLFNMIQPMTYMHKRR